MYPGTRDAARPPVFLPPIGGITVYIFGDSAQLGDRRSAARPAACMTNATARTCSAPTSAPAGPISSTASRSACAQAQSGGVGVVVYNRKEGRALGEVTKFLVYNARKRQEGGDQAATYFERTECVAGVQDARFQQLMPDVLHWLGIRGSTASCRCSNMKYDAMVEQGIEIVERVPIPAELVPPDARVEMEAKKAAGYYAPDGAPTSRGPRSAPSAAPLEKHVMRLADGRSDAAAALLERREAVRERAARASTHSACDGRGCTHWRSTSSGWPARGRAGRRGRRARPIPTLDVPFHARWRHFAAGGVDRWAGLDRGSGDDAAGARGLRPRHRLRAARCRRGHGLALREAATGMDFARSEGLAVASFDMFVAGAFAGRRPQRRAPMPHALASARRAEDLAAGFQVRAGQSAGRPRRPRRAAAPAGRDGRRRTPTSSAAPTPRPGGLFDAWPRRPRTARCPPAPS